MQSFRNRILVLLPAAVVAAAQPPRVHDINVYGLGKVSKERILHAVKVRAGDPLPGSKGDMEDRMAELPGVAGARVEAVCCEGSEVNLFLGIEERGGPRVAFRSEPQGDIALAEDLAEAYREYASAMQRASYRGQSGAEVQGQQQFAAFAEKRMEELRRALREAADPEQRAIAAAVIGYAPSKKDVVDDLQYALQDPDELVRHNALRSLHDIALLGVRQPKLGIRVSPTWLIELMNSLVLSDRVQAADILITLTDGGDRAVIDQIRARALPALVEMARWETLPYALPPFLLVGRVAGMSDAETQRRWSAGEREPVIARALGRAAARPRGR